MHSFISPSPVGWFALRACLIALASSLLLPIASAQDDHGNTTASATTVTPGTSASGQLGGNGDIDLFKVVLSSAGILTAQTTSQIDTYGQLYNGSVQLLQSDDDSGADYNFSFSRSVSAGTYYIAVRGYSTGEVGAYTLLTSFAASGGSGGTASVSVTGTNGTSIPSGSAASTSAGTDFGAVNVTSGSKSLTVTVANTGQSSLSITGVTLSGTGASQFSRTTSPAPSVAAGSSTNFRLVFDPSSAGIHQATVTIATSAAQNANYTFSIRGEGTSTTQPPATDDATAVLNLVNQARAAQGLGAVTLNAQLTQAATTHANDMNQNNFFSHTGSDGSNIGTRVTRTGYSWSTAGENIARGQTSPQNVMNDWMNSSGHRANILNSNFTEMGLAHVGLYWVQVFARPRN